MALLEHNTFSTMKSRAIISFNTGNPMFKGKSLKMEMIDSACPVYARAEIITIISDFSLIWKLLIKRLVVMHQIVQNIF